MIFLNVLLLSVLATGSEHNLKPFFESPEHVLIGEQVTLKGLKDQFLTLANGLKVSFGDMVAMPDFYGVAGAPISKVHLLNEQKSRFLNAFESLAKQQSSVQEATKIIELLHTQRDRLAQKLPPLKSGDEQHMEYNCITGGACSGTMWWLSPGRYLELAKQDFDHFGKNARASYIAGHQLALETATQGKLELAYAMEAFADHFLTDRFAAGHLRTPRVRLPKHISPAVVGSLLGGYMHQEENENGLHVHNARGDQWTAFGDSRHLDDRNTENKALMHEALIISTDEIYQAFLSRQMPIQYKALELFPEPDENGSNVKHDITPLFYWEPKTKTIMRRSSTKDIHDTTYTNTWWGWSTLAQLRFERGSI